MCICIFPVVRETDSGVLLTVRLAELCVFPVVREIYS